MSIRRNPFADIERLFDRLGRQFEEASRSRGHGDPIGLLGGVHAMPVDLIDRDNEYVVTVDVPGCDREEIELRATETTIRINARHEESVDEETDSYVRRERREQSFGRTVHLPEPIEPDGTTAALNNGVLTITLPKAEPAGARTIDIA